MTRYEIITDRFELTSPTPWAPMDEDQVFELCDNFEESETATTEAHYDDLEEAKKDFRENWLTFPRTHQTKTDDGYLLTGTVAWIQTVVYDETGDNFLGLGEKQMHAAAPLTRYYKTLRFNDGKPHEFQFNTQYRPEELWVDGVYCSMTLYANTHDGKCWQTTPSGNLLYYRGVNGRQYALRQNFFREGVK